MEILNHSKYLLNLKQFTLNKYKIKRKSLKTIIQYIFKNKYILLMIILIFIILIILLIIENNNIYINKNKYNKIIGISYANDRFKTQLEYNRKSAIEIGKVDEYYGYGPDDIDKEFKEKYKDILTKKRGNGYWLWKPYFILKTVKEKLNYGDYLIYTDACVLYRNNSKNLVDYINNKKADMWVRQHIDNLYEKDWTKRDTFIIMGLDTPFYAYTNQYD